MLLILVSNLLFSSLYLLPKSLFSFCFDNKLLGSCLQANGEFDELAGITPRAVSEIFRLLNERASQITFEVNVQMFQLYRDGLEDLLKVQKKKGEDKGSSLKITLAEHSPTGLVQVEGANTMVAQTPADVMSIFQLGMMNRLYPIIIVLTQLFFL